MKLLQMTCLTVFASYAWTLDPDHNQTQRRERLETIPTIYGDLRRDMVFVPPALPLPAYYSAVRFHGHYEHVWRDWGRDGDHFEGRRYRLDATWRQVLWRGGRVMSEMRVGGVHQTANDQAVVATDMDVRLLVPLLRDRYAGLMVGLGTLFGWGTGTDLDDAHAESYSKPGWSAEVRGSWGAGLTVSQSFLRLRWFPRALSELDTPRRMSETDVVPAEPWPHHFYEATGGVGWSWRLSTSYRFGLEGVATYRYWDGRKGDDRGFGDWSGAGQLFQELTVGSGVHVTVAGGVDPFVVGHDFERAWMASSAIQITF